MTSEEKSNVIIDGSSIVDLELTEKRHPYKEGHWEFLTRVVPGNPWIAGLAAILGIVVLGNAPWVQGLAIVGVTVITVSSTLDWRLDGQSKTTNEPRDVGEDTRKDRNAKRYLGQRLAFGSDPPVS